MSTTKKPRFKFNTRVISADADSVLCEFTRSELGVSQEPVVIANVKFLDLSGLIERNKKRIEIAKAKKQHEEISATKEDMKHSKKRVF